MKKLLFTLLILTLSLVSIYAQTRRITGNVTSSEDGRSIPGVSVFVKGTTVGTITDIDGNFQLNVPESAEIIVYSFVGLKSVEVPITTEVIYNLIMEPELVGVEEVVVTAIGIKRNARSLTYAVQQVDGEEVGQKIETDVIRALSGRVAGVNISGSGGAAGSATNITIRGNSSALGNNQPLFVVDGIPFDNTQTNTQNPNIHGSTYSNRALDIDPNDIESISVLKGGSSAALYGSRASNGVILITTKRGGTSGDGKDFNVSLSSTFALEEPAKMPSYQNEYGQGANFNFDAGFMGTWGPAFDDPIEHLANDANLFNDNGVIKYINHLGDAVPYKAYPNNISDFFRTGNVIENSLSVSGGDAETNFITVFSTSNNKGFIPFSGLDKYSLKVGGNKKVGDKLTVGGQITYVNTIQDGISTGGFGVTNTNVFGQFWWLPRNYDLTGLPYIDPNTQENIHYRADFDNPRYLVQENRFKSIVNRTYGYGSINYDFTSDLKLSYKLGFTSYTDRRQQIYAKSTQYNGTNGAIFDEDISVSDLESNLVLTYDKKINPDFTIGIIAGYNITQSQYDRQSFEGNDIIVHGIDRLENTNTIIPGTYSNLDKYRLVGLLSEVNIGYKNWAFLTVNGRNDWSSTLPVENNSYFYWSATGSVILTDAFKIESNVLSYLKVYGGLSRIGNDAGTYLTKSTYTVNPIYGNNVANMEFPFVNVAGLAVGNRKGSLELKPEITRDYEFGADIQLFNQRLSFELAYYDKATEDQIFNVTVPASSGYIAQTLNAGKITNKGFELAAKVRPIYSPNGFKWEINYNFSKNKTKIVELFEGVEQISVGTNYVGFDIVHRVGESFGNLEIQKLRRDDEGNLLIDPELGYATMDTEATVSADPNPDYVMSLDNQFSFKGFNLGFLFSYQKGGDLYSNTVSTLRLRGVVEETAINREAGRIIKGVLADPEDPSIPMLVNGEKVENNVVITTNDYYFNGFPGFESGIFDASVLRLREATLGYTLPKSMISKLPFESLSLTLIGRNLWMYAPNIPHIDPEVNAYGAGNRQGVDFYYIPNARRIALNLKVTF